MNSVMDAEAHEDNAVVVYGELSSQKARSKRQKLLVRDIFNDYANNTTLHGLSYTTKTGVTLTEKIFWLITFIVSICLCCFLMRNVWIKWKTSPVIVTVSEQLVPVGKVPFPSVTICPQFKSKASVYNFTAALINLKALVKNNPESFNASETEFTKFDDVSNVCLYTSHWHMYKFDALFQRNYSNADVARNIINVAPKKDDLFTNCEWRDIIYDMGCKKTLTETLTSEGLCYNVNSLSANEILRLENIHQDYAYLSANISAKSWTIEHGYSEYGPEVYPVAGKENGAFPDLDIIMRDQLSDRDNVCNILYSGFKVFVQHPADLPQSSLYYYTVLNSQVSSMALSFSILNTSETLRKYSPQIRQCYFPEERYLKYFKIYTANNCRLECLSNYTFELCGCVGFYMPRENSNRICTTNSRHCMKDARDKLVNRTFYAKVDECLCLPACNSIDYEAEILKTEFNLKKSMRSFSQIEGISLGRFSSQFSKLEMYFKRPRFVSMRRSELFGLTDFLANIGGLLGLFLGFSFLSLVEIIYFLTLRLCCMFKKDFNEEKIQRRNTLAMRKKY